MQYNTALTIFFVPYIVFEIPSNIFLKRFSPRIWLSGCCLGFGLLTTMQGLVQNYAGLLATRFFLGVFECGMFPGCFYVLGMCLIVSPSVLVGRVLISSMKQKGCGISARKHRSDIRSSFRPPP